jgi:hypothetical protein
MKPMRTLPENYIHCDTLESGKHKTLQGVLALAGIGAFLIFWQAIKYIFPDFVGALRIGNTVSERIAGAGRILLGIFIIVILHEGIHGLIMQLFTGTWPPVKVKLFYAYVDASNWYLPQNIAMAMNLAPVVLLSAIGVLLLSFESPPVLQMIFWGVLFNVAGSVNDVAVALWLSLQPDTVLVKNSGNTLSIYRASDSQALEMGVRKRLRVLLERTLLKLE